MGGGEGALLVAIPATLLVAHLMHSQLLAFHEAAHGVLCPSRTVNELVGILIGKFHFNGLSLFRAVHHTHHAHLGTEKDDSLAVRRPRRPAGRGGWRRPARLSLGMPSTRSSSGGPSSTGRPSGTSVYVGGSGPSWP